MLELDAQTAMRYASGEKLDDLRPMSRANARVPLPEWIYDLSNSNKVDLLLRRIHVYDMYHLILDWKTR